jgi:drug/metabolite transporter (DMT)-like permease
MNLWHAALAGAAFFFGQVFTFLALSRGDVSVATPVLGTKVVFVALFTVALTREPIPPAWWGAAALTVAATWLMGGGKAGRGDGVFARSLAYGLAAAAGFSLTDVFAQKWAPAWGFSHFAPALFATVALLSFSLISQFQESIWSLSGATWRWLAPGALLLTAQAAGVAFAIMNFGAATRVNVLYASRGVWSVAIVWAIGHWFGNEERGHGHWVMARRFCGAVLLLAAIVLVVG